MTVGEFIQAVNEVPIWVVAVVLIALSPVFQFFSLLGADAYLAVKRWWPRWRRKIWGLR